MKRFFVISLLVIMCLLLTVDVFAEKASTDNQVTKIGNLTIQRVMSSASYFSDWGNTINYQRSGKLEISSYTESYNSAEKVYVKAYLQRYNSSTRNWENIEKMYSSRNDDDYVSIDKTVAVAEGYKYRVYSIHKVTIDSGTKTKTLTSESVYVK